MSLTFHIQSTLILVLLYTGYFLRKNRKMHISLMSIGIIWDVILILQIELNRHAIHTALTPRENSWLLNFHITIATLVVVFYVFLIILGRKLLRGDESKRRLHGRLGRFTLALRTAVLITSHLVETHKPL